MTYHAVVIADIHGNLEALRAVLAHARGQGAAPDAIWCLGDIVGYGPDPGGCIDELLNYERTHGTPVRTIAGNHDRGVLGDDAGTYESVRESWKWTKGQLSVEQLRYLDELPATLAITDTPRSALLVHATPQDPLNAYMAVPAVVEASIPHLAHDLCLFGHTHLACYFECTAADNAAVPRRFGREQGAVTLAGAKIFLNPGTVGQPRYGRVNAEGGYDGVQEATYVWLELDEAFIRARCHFVAYPWRETVAKLERLQTQLPVPERWLERLRNGLR